MNDNPEPYDDSAPFPPEWQEGQEDLPKSLEEIMLALTIALMPQEEKMTHVKEAKSDMKNAMAKLASLSVFGGICACESMDLRREEKDQSVNMYLRVNLAQAPIEAAGLTAKEVRETIDIYFQGIKDFFISIKNQSIDKGLTRD